MVYTFFGTDSKVGVTMIAQCAAERISQLMPKSRVCLLHLDGREGTEYSTASYQGGLEEVMPSLSSGILTTEELMNNMALEAGVYQLRGNTRFDFHPEQVRKLLELLAAGTVVIDAGNDIELGMALGALQYADRNILITTQHQLSWDRWQKKEEVQRGLNLFSFDLLIVNKCFDHPPLLTMKRMAERHGIPDTIKAAYSPFGMQADLEHETLSSYRFPPFRNAVDECCRFLGVEVPSLNKGRFFNRRKGAYEKV